MQHHGACNSTSSTVEWGTRAPSNTLSLSIVQPDAQTRVAATRSMTPRRPLTHNTATISRSPGGAMGDRHNSIGWVSGLAIAACQLPVATAQAQDAGADVSA